MPIEIKKPSPKPSPKPLPKAPAQKKSEAAQGEAPPWEKSPSVQLVAKAPKASVNKAYKDGSVVDEEILMEPKMVPLNPAVVSVNIGVTRNLGNYESVKFSVQLSMPCDPSDVDSTFNEAKGWVDSRVELINQEITAQLEGN